jgi:hypothetical protein
VCELPVTQLFEHPVPAPLVNVPCVWLVPDTHYQRQVGPVCGAASVAGTLLSLARYHGLDTAAVKEVLDTRFVQDLYAGMGVPNVYVTTAAVGNLAIKRAFMTVRFPLPGHEGWQATVTEFGSRLVTEPGLKADVDWDKLRAGMQAGARFLYHSRNHYARVFGWREFYCAQADGAGAQPCTVAVRASTSNEGEGGARSAARCSVGCAPAAWSASLVEGEAGAPRSPLRALAPARTTNAGLAAPGLGVPGEPMAGGASYAAPSRSAHKEAGSGSPQTACMIESGGATWAPLAARSWRVPAPVAAASAATSSALGPGHVGNSTHVVRREVLLAKRGQRPQHWVPWEAVCADIGSHKLHTIFEVRLVQRGKA